eukprot:TRINITY_DN18730_c0_g1_i3.p1 TRINITY_DN18730_c0_g1~~TRINITY_DN18730_c0_g1_i3.p1  ORF type:complete len:196 (+),score=38.14 TRINITY_DN18730_c0_g1_i3:199-786(+)
MSTSARSRSRSPGGEKGRSRSRSPEPEAPKGDDTKAQGSLAMPELFQKNTTEATWTPEGTTRSYTLRWMTEKHDESFHANQTIKEDPSWPRFTITRPSEDDENESDEVINRVVGAVWTSDGTLVAVWAEDEGDSHVSMYGQEGFEFAEPDLNEVTSELCSSIDESMGDVFDDGSGGEREAELGAEFTLAAAALAK